MEALTSFTPVFQEVLLKTKELLETKGEEPGRQFFLAEMRRIGYKERIKNLYKVQGKGTEFVRFRPNKEQCQFIEDRSGRDIILKSRQIGFTTFACIYAYDRALWDGWRTGIMAHMQESVKVFFDTVKNANEHFKKDWGWFFSPEEAQSNTTRLSWVDSKASITVAFNFQGYTLNFLHISEAAFVQPPSRLTFSIQAVPEEGEIVLESTPNGPGGFYYNVYQDWKRLKGSAPFRGHFFPWFTHYPENKENPKWQKQPGVHWNQEEEELKELYKLEDYHLAWRRFKMAESCENNPEVFEIQYLSDDVSCFLAGKNSVYPRGVLKFQEQFVTEPSFVGSLTTVDKNVEFRKDRKGLLSIWDLPKPNGLYYGGADPSSGLGGDPGCAIVINARTGEQVAELHGFMDPDVFADELWKLGHFYNQCFWCIEANNHGSAVILKLKSQYPNLYKRQNFDSIAKRFSYEVGFLTTNSSKVTITDNHVAACRDGSFKARSASLLSELGTFDQLAGKQGRTIRREARTGCHDDRVIAACLSFEMLRSRPVSEYKELSNPLADMGMIVDPITGFYQASGNSYLGYE